MPMPIVKWGVVGLGLLWAACSVTSPAVAQDRISRGGYLAAIMDCSGCHTTGALLGSVLRRSVIRPAATTKALIATTADAIRKTRSATSPLGGWRDVTGRSVPAAVPRARRMW